jgi:hypothetical protein
MAALTATRVGNRLPIGDRFLVTFRVTIANANAADEWVAAGPSGTGLRWIDRVIGVVDVNATADETEVPVVLKNEGTGTAGTEGTTGGALAIEGNAGTYEISLIGKQ